MFAMYLGMACAINAKICILGILGAWVRARISVSFNAKVRVSKNLVVLKFRMTEDLIFLCA